MDEVGNVSIDGELNNLGRNEYEELYLDIRQLFQAMLPMFERYIGRGLKSLRLSATVDVRYHFLLPGMIYQGEMISPS